MRLLSLLVLVFFISHVGFSQSNTPNKENNDARSAFLEQKKELEGAYQVQFINVRGQFALTSKMLDFIENNQKENQDVTIDYSKNMRLVIRSKQSVANNNVFSEDERVIYTRD